MEPWWAVARPFAREGGQAGGPGVSGRGPAPGVSARPPPRRPYSASRFVSQLKQSQPGRTGSHRVRRR